MLTTAWVSVVVLAIVQGVAEFLPISSSGHLVILGKLLESVSGSGFSESDSLRLNVALHFGTLLSILVVCRRHLRLTHEHLVPHEQQVHGGEDHTRRCQRGQQPTRGWRTKRAE